MRQGYLLWLVALLAWVSPGASFAQDNTFPHGPVDMPWGRVEAEFHAGGDLAIIMLRRPDGQSTPLVAIDSVSEAIAVLDDKRLAFAWPALLAWAGEDLTRLRDRAVVRAQVAAQAGLIVLQPSESEQYVGDRRLAASLQYARALDEAGQKSTAIAFLKGEIDQVPEDTGHSAQRVFLLTRLASVLFDSGRTSEAIVLLDKGLADQTIDESFSVNLSVNLASYLARTGQSQRALTVIDSAWALFGAAPEEDAESYKVPSGEAYFASIKACALSGLGRTDEARAFIRRIAIVPPSRLTSASEPAARLLAFTCMHDVGGLANEIVTQIGSAEPAADVFNSLQPLGSGYPAEVATLRSALALLQVRRATEGRLNILGPEFSAALNKWSTSAASGAR